MIASSSGLKVDVELCELQLDVVDVVEEQHQNPYVVVSEQHRMYGRSLSKFQIWVVQTSKLSTETVLINLSDQSIFHHTYDSVHLCSVMWPDVVK